MSLPATGLALAVWVTVTSAAGGGPKEAPRLVGTVIVTVQLPNPVHAPLQPLNSIPASGVAESVTAVPYAKAAEHVGPQLIPAGALVTRPFASDEMLSIGAVGTKE